MRTTITATTTTVSPLSSPSSAEAPPDMAASSRQSSPWHYPIPYLLGGLVTMTLLVVGAVLILACSFWHRYGEGGSRRGGCSDLEPGGGESVKVYTDKVLVIMAGNDNPTYLATPIPVFPTTSPHQEKTEEDNMEENSGKSKELQAASSTSVLS